jgi:hypothetical protein
MGIHSNGLCGIQWYKNYLNWLRTEGAKSCWGHVDLLGALKKYPGVQAFVQSAVNISPRHEMP